MSKLSKKFSGEEKTVAKNYGALTVLQALNYILPFLIIPFLERTLGLERFGLVMLAQYLMAFCVAAADFGFTTTATREISILKAKNADYSDIYFKVFWARIFLLIIIYPGLKYFNNKDNLGIHSKIFFALLITYIFPLKPHGSLFTTSYASMLWFLYSLNLYYNINNETKY